MKIQELRTLLGKTDRALLEKAFAEIYKEFPKSQKEEIDQIILDTFSGKNTVKSTAKTRADFDALKQEVEEFIENAYARNYFAPNPVISKSKRPKWRFYVRNYIKEFLKISSEDEHYPEMITLFTDIYRVLCEACNYYLFSTDDPFRSIGWQQPELFRALVKKTFENGYSRESISSLLLMSACGGLSRESLHIQQQIVLLEELESTEVKNITLDEAKRLVKENKTQVSKYKKNSNEEYHLTEANNYLCNMILLLSIDLKETDEGIRYYFGNCREYNREIILHNALNVVNRAGGDTGLWMKVYQYGTSEGIKPRESLILKYKKLKKESSK